MYTDILKFWFEDIDQSKWWVKDAELDKTIIEKFSSIHSAATRGELFEWRITPKGRLAEIIVLDQFSRNMFRDSAQAFSYDAIALVLAQEAVAAGADKLLTPSEAMFMYLPFMHSESLTIHEHALELFSAKGMEDTLDFELKHKIIIEKFGRYPHRNKVLGRVSTPEEIKFLTQPNSSF
ncbi:membrane protein [Cellvibrio zantedeschiae]|uniref:Membrane protein n=1 Tax=Cellvibrio zantedeschiae TaxID=1237077 RepID=A0ABQ3ARJ9_9GAMM|nr:DUF924 family protein [Cellvibrio zantedeschiae]GGY61822.1 membrane protein [Cellvibrio zantedeschiae]